MTHSRKLLSFALAAATISACGDDGTIDLSRYPTSADGADRGAGDDTDDTAVRVAIGSSSQRTLFPVGDVDYFEVQLEAGVEYEFSTWGLCATCDTYLTLFGVDGTTVIDADDDNIGLDSYVSFTPNASGTYYVAVRAFSPDYGIATYTFRAHEVVDGDGDGYSVLYDCDDTDPDVYFEATDVAGDGIDQDCSGSDLPLGTSADRFEDDDTAATATRSVDLLPAEWGYAVYDLDFYAGRERTIHETGDQDWFRITIPAYTQFDFDTDTLAGGGIATTYFESDGVTVRADGLTNDTASAVDVRIRVTGDVGAVYAVYHYDLGRDVDGDGFYDADWDSDRDCDDGDPDVNSDATEVAGDGVDSDCDGAD